METLKQELPSQLCSLFFLGACATDSSPLLGTVGTAEPHFQGTKGVLCGIRCTTVYLCIASTHSAKKITVYPNSDQIWSESC